MIRTTNNSRRTENEEEMKMVWNQMDDAYYGKKMAPLLSGRRRRQETTVSRRDRRQLKTSWSRLVKHFDGSAEFLEPAERLLRLTNAGMDVLHYARTDAAFRSVVAENVGAFLEPRYENLQHPVDTSTSYDPKALHALGLVVDRMSELYPTG